MGRWRDWIPGDAIGQMALGDYVGQVSNQGRASQQKGTAQYTIQGKGFDKITLAGRLTMWLGKPAKSSPLLSRSTGNMSSLTLDRNRAKPSELILYGNTLTPKNLSLEIDEKLMGCEPAGALSHRFFSNPPGPSVRHSYVWRSYVYYTQRIQTRNVCAPQVWQVQSVARRSRAQHYNRAHEDRA